MRAPDPNACASKVSDPPKLWTEEARAGKNRDPALEALIKGARSATRVQISNKVLSLVILATSSYSLSRKYDMGRPYR